ncbi:MAG: iron ABC transporter permease [Endomicrobiales bacterium]|nr:iron ABC transporter permease [Endomicrobiales bacterium]
MNKKIGITSLLLILFLLTVFLSLIAGGNEIKAGDVFSSLLNPDTDSVVSTIVWKIRVPRIILGILVGIGLSISGCVLQAILRNPLADPYTLGISGGAALGATFAIVTGIAGLSMVSLPLFAFTGTLASMLLVYYIASRYNFSVYTLILAGVIIGFLFSSLVLLIIALSDTNKMHSTILWLMGDLSSPARGLIRIVAFFVFSGLLMLLYFGRELNILTLGDEKAQHLGVNAEFIKKIVFIAASFITGACVSVSGTIGFAGLIVPHIMRWFFGYENRMLILMSALGGAIFLPMCDTLARTVIYPVELPVGVVTGIFGGTFFLVLLLKSDKTRIF